MASLGESLQEVRSQLQTARSEAQAQQEETAAEREALREKLREAQDRGAELSAQLVTERTTQQSALERMDHQYQASLKARTAEGQQLERALSDLRARYDEMLGRSRDESENFAATVYELERRCEQLTDDSHAVREVLEGAVRTERECYAVLSDAQAQWQTELAKVLSALGDASARTECVVDSILRRRPRGLARARHGDRKRDAMSDALRRDPALRDRLVSVRNVDDQLLDFLLDPASGDQDQPSRGQI